MKPVTLITGTRKGIGKFLAEHCIGQGHSVVGCSRSAIDWELDGYQHFTADVADEKAVKKIFSWIKKEFGHLENLINNAGVASMNHSLLTPMSSVQKIINTNITGTFLFSREAAKLMTKNNYGRIINFTTVANPLELEGECVYAASKAAVESMTRIMAREFAEFGITVNSIGPTPVKTDLIRSIPDDKIEKLISRQAIKRMGTFEDVSNVIDFFLRPESSFVTGQILYLGGV